MKKILQCALCLRRDTIGVCPLWICGVYDVTFVSKNPFCPEVDVVSKRGNSLFDFRSRLTRLGSIVSPPPSPFLSSSLFNDCVLLRKKCKRELGVGGDSFSYFHCLAARTQICSLATALSSTLATRSEVVILPRVALDDLLGRPVWVYSLKDEGHQDSWSLETNDLARKDLPSASVVDASTMRL